MSRTDFVPRRMTQLVPGTDSRDVDVISIARALGERNHEVKGLQPRFGGKAYDITWSDEIEPTEAATSGVDIAGRHYDLRLLGCRSIDVSIFVTCEFPDTSLADLLDRYGEFNHESIRHLHLKDEGLQHIENGVRVVTFTRIERPIPHTVIYRGTPLGFRYMGQPKLCFKCASPDHVVRDCPKKFPPPENIKSNETEPNPLPTEQNTLPGETEQNENANPEPTNTESHHDNDPSNMETTESLTTSQEIIPENSTPITEPSSKCARAVTPPASDNEHSPAELSQASQDQTTNFTPPLFSPTPETRKIAIATSTITPQAASDKPKGPRQKKISGKG